MESIKILQISDIHWGNASSMVDSFKNLRDGMKGYLEEYKRQNKEKFDYILICGDIAFSAQKSQYDKATDFIKDLCKIAECKESEVLIVPGNHDKDRNAQPVSLREALNEYMGRDDKDADWMLDNSLQGDINSCKFLFEPFREYECFARSFGGSGRLTSKLLAEGKISAFSEKDDKMYWKRELSDNLNGFKVVAYGVNSAFNCDKNDFNFSEKGLAGHKMFLPKLAYAEPRRKDHVINIVMMHHPISFLAHNDAIEKDLDSRFQLQFFGHVHRTDSNSNNGAIHIYSGALQPPEDEASANVMAYRPVFNILNLSVKDVSSSESTLVVDLDVIAWDGSTFCKSQEKSKQLTVAMKRLALENKMVPTGVTLPDGISKNDIIIDFINSIYIEEVINDLKPVFYNHETSDYINALNFIDYVAEKNLWCELWNKLNEYEG